MRDESVGRIVRDEVPRELGGEMLRGRGAASERREHLLAFGDPALLVGLAEHDLVAGLMQAVAKVELARLTAPKPALPRRRWTSP